MTVPDGRPDYIVIAQRADFPLFNPDPAFTEVGVAFLIDGATGAVLHIYDHPEPQKDALYGFTTGRQFPLGDLGDSALPDVVLAGFQNVDGTAQAGRGYVSSATSPRTSSSSRCSTTRRQTRSGTTATRRRGWATSYRERRATRS